MVATSPSPQVPLSIEPMIGWRVWRLADDRGELTLRAFAHGSFWPAQQVVAASCTRSGGHPSPSERCTCGYYAADSLASLMRSNVFHNGVCVIGAIAMWGTVIEHARGARAEFVYPARLRLLCVKCLERHRLVDPALVFGQGSDLRPLCAGHARGHTGGIPALEVQAALLDRYGVELLPMPKVPGLAARGVARMSLRGLGKALVGLFMVARFIVSLLFMMWLFGLVLALGAFVIGVVFSILGAGVGFVTGGGDPPAPAISIAAPLHPTRSWVRVAPHRGVPPPPAVAATAAPCGIGLGDRVELVKCSDPRVDVLGLATRSRPRGQHHDCVIEEPYSRGAHWYVCWIALPGAYVHPWPQVQNPFRARDGGVIIHGDR